jgi:hypothetical protein
MKDAPIAPEGVLNAARRVAGVGPGQRMQIGTGAQGQSMWHVADEPTPAGELSGLTRKRAIELAMKGVPWPTAMTQAIEESNTAAAGRTTAVTAAGKQAGIDTEFGTPANVDTVAAGKAKIAADTERAKSNVGFERPPTALPQPTGAPGAPPPIDQPPPGLNRQQLEAWQKARAAAVADTLPASERARFSELYTLVDSIAELRKLTHDFDVETAGGWFGPIRGYVTGPFEESLTGSMSPEEVKARRVMYDMSDMLLRARSGAQINEQEYARLAKLLALPERPFNTAKARFEDFERQLLTIIKNRSMLQSAPAGNLPPPTRPIQTPENTLRFDNRGRRVK